MAGQRIMGFLCCVVVVKSRVASVVFSFIVIHAAEITFYSLTFGSSSSATGGLWFRSRRVSFVECVSISRAG